MNCIIFSSIYSPLFPPICLKVQQLQIMRRWQCLMDAAKLCFFLCLIHKQTKMMALWLERPPENWGSLPGGTRFGRGLMISRSPQSSLVTSSARPTVSGLIRAFVTTACTQSTVEGNIEDALLLNPVAHMLCMQTIPVAAWGSNEIGIERYWPKQGPF